MLATIFWSLAQAEPEPANDVKDLYPHWEELLVGALAFAVLFFFMWKWVLPRINTLLEELRKAPAVLRLSYVADIEDAALVERRVEAVKRQFRS